MIGDSSITNHRSQITNRDCHRVWLSPISSRGGAKTTTRRRRRRRARFARPADQGARAVSRRPRRRGRSRCCSTSARSSAPTSRSSARSSAARFSSRISPRTSIGTCTRSKLEELPAFFETRFPQEAGTRRRHSLLGHLRLPRAAGGGAARASADADASAGRRAARVLQHGRSALRRPARPTRGTSSSTARTCSTAPYTAARGKQRPLLNRDIQRLFEPLRITEQFLLKTNLREVLFRKPAAAAAPTAAPPADR